MASVVQEELKVCRVCLALDVKMYNMNDFKLSEMFQNITGIMATDIKSSILQRVCWECAARLTAAAAFREKALLSDALLKDQVHIKESDIALLKQNYSSLKSPLSVVTTYYIECEHTMSENKEIDNIFTPNDKTAVKERKTKTRMNEKDIEFEEYEPWIDVPVKTEVEPDPIAVNNMRFHDRKSDEFFEQSNDASLREDIEDEMTNTEVQINNNDTILGDTENKVPYINDDNINFEKDDDTVDEIPKLDGLSNIVYEDSSEEDTHSEDASFNKYKQNMSSKEKKERATISKHTSLHDDLKEQIVALKQEGTNNSRIAFLLGTTRFTVRRWWDRWCKEGHVNKHKRRKKKRKTTVLEDQLLIERVAQEQAVHTPSLAKELGISTQCVRNRLKEAGFKPQERKASVPLRSGRSHKVDEVTKQQIISMKNNGVSVTEIANQFRVTRTSVYKWWRRWCKENSTEVKHNTIESDQRNLSKKKSGNLKKSGAVSRGYTLRKRS